VVAATHELASPSRRMGVIRAIDEWHRSVVARACSRRGRRGFQPLPRLDTTMVVEIEVGAATGAEIRDPKICVYGGPDAPQGKRARLVTCSLRQPRFRSKAGLKLALWTLACFFCPVHSL
jgi:hypothetical protein